MVCLLAAKELEGREYAIVPGVPVYSPVKWEENYPNCFTGLCGNAQRQKIHGS